MYGPDGVFPEIDLPPGMDLNVGPRFCNFARALKWNPHDVFCEILEHAFGADVYFVAFATADAATV